MFCYYAQLCSSQMGELLCSYLCRHNVPRPSQKASEALSGGQKFQIFLGGTSHPDPPRWLMVLGPEAWAPSLLQGILNPCVCHIAIATVPCIVLATVSLFYCHTLSLSLPYCPTVLLSHCHTVSLSYCPTALYCLLVILSHCHNVYCPTVLSLCHTVSLSPCHTIPLS